MGQSTPTTTMALDAFEERYAGFRAELDPPEQRWFDELVCRARRHSNAINRRPALDFERPVLLSMLLEGLREHEELQRRIESLQAQVEELGRALVEAGLVMPRVPTRTTDEMNQVGQTRLPRRESDGIVPA